RIPDAPARLQLQALGIAGLTAFHVLTDTERADRYWASARAIAEQLGETDELGWIESRQAAVVWERGDLDQALALAERGLIQARATGNRFRQAQWLHGLGE